MQIDVNTVMTDLEGNAIKDGEKELMFAHVALFALNANFEDEKIDFKEKTERFSLMCKIQESKEYKKFLTISVEDASLLKKLIGKTWNVIICGRVKQLIEDKKETA